MNLHQRIQTLLNDLPLQQRRTLRPVGSVSPGMLRLENGKPVVDFASNDYLGLAGNRDMISRANQWARRYGAGARASRLVSGNLPAVQDLESKLAALKGSQAALIMGGGFQANSAVIAALLDRRLNTENGRVQLFADRLCHASFHFGVAAAGCRQHRFRHNDLEHLSQLLDEKSDGNPMPVIASESLFSMDGDRLNVTGIRDIARRYDAVLYVDEAHATGLYGQNGMGLMSGAMHQDDIAIGTFGKALGSFGSYVACSNTIRDYLVNRCSGFIYSTGLSPMICGAIEWAVDNVAAMETQRTHLETLSRHLRNGLQVIGANTGPGDSHIIPVIVGDDQKVMQLAERLLAEGFLVGAIRPPTVPAGTSRLRISLSACHTMAQINRLLECLEPLLKRYGLVEESREMG